MWSWRMRKKGKSEGRRRGWLVDWSAANERYAILFLGHLVCEYNK